jgi:hypothetical protein
MRNCFQAHEAAFMNGRCFRNEKVGGKMPVTNKQGIIIVSAMNGLMRLKPTRHCRHIIMSPVSP